MGHWALAITSWKVTYTYTSSSATVATVSAAGVVTAVAPGTATITITAAGTGTGFSAATLTSAMTITVSDRTPGLTSLQVQPTTTTLAIGGTQQVTASAQGPRASAATITYGTSAPAIATVSSTGVISAVATGTAVITVTAQSTESGQFGASSITGLVTVTVSQPANVTIQTITQGPIKTTANDAGIVTSINENVNQPVDITNVRDQIQVVANLQPNGQRVDSVVAFIAEADGSNRLAAARQLYSNGVANAGDVTLFINTADFTVEWTTPSATTRYKNGQKQISISVFGPSGEIQTAQNIRQTMNFANLDGWAARYANPTRSTTRVNSTATNLTWWGGPGTEGQGSYSVAAVTYTLNRAVSTFRTGMMSGAFPTLAPGGPSLSAGSEVCVAVRGGTGRNSVLGEFYGTASTTVTGANLTYNASLGVATANSSFAATTGNNNIECGEYEMTATDGAANLFNYPGVLLATDNNNNNYPRVTAINGFRTSASVPQIAGNRVDYLGPSTQTYGNSSTQGGGYLNEPDLRRTVNVQGGQAPITGWVNADFSITSQTASNSDAGVGRLASTSAQRALRTWYVYGCGVAFASATTFDGTGNTLNECTDDSDARGGYDATATATAELALKTRGPYQVFYTEPDLLGNVSSSASRARVAGSSLISARFGVDKTAPQIRWSTAGDVLAFGGQDTLVVTAANVASAFRVEFFDSRAGFIDTDDNGNTVILLDEAAASASAATVSTTATINSLGASGFAVPTYRSQQHFLSQAAGYLNAANWPTRARCTVPTTDVDDATADATEQQYSFIGYSIASGNSIKATGADIVTNPTCAFWNAANLQTTILGDGYRSGMTVALPDAGAYRYSTRVYDRAGNVSSTLTRWVSMDAASSAPVAQIGTLLSVAQGSDETFPITFEDRSEVRGANIQVSYPRVAAAGAANIGYLVYPKQLLDARFNNTVNSPTQTTISTPNGAAFISAMEFTAANAVTAAADIDKPTLAQSHVFDVQGSNFLTQNAVLGTALANPTDWSAWITANPARAFNSFGVLTTLDAGFNAGAGLKAQVVAPTNAINAPFTRVEFFRLTSVPAGTPEGGAARTEWQYLGTSSTAIPGDGGSVRYWTYLIGSYANSPYSLNTTQSAAQTADVIMAVGVRSTGEGLASVGVIGGNILNLSVTGLPAGAAANVTITNPATGYIATYTAAGTYPLPDGTNTYNVTVGNSIFNNIQYIGTGSSATVTSSSNITTFTATYRANITQLKVKNSGLILGHTNTFKVDNTGTTPTFSFTGAALANNVESGNIVVPVAGTYQASSPSGATFTTAVSPAYAGASAQFTYNVTSSSVITVGPSDSPVQVATVTYANQTKYVRLTVTGLATGATVSTTCDAEAAVSTTGNVTEKVITEDGAGAASCVTTAGWVLSGGVWYEPTITGGTTTATTAGGAAIVTVAYAPVASQISITSASAGGVGENMPNGLSYTVRVTSSAYAAGFQDFTCTKAATGADCVIPIVPGTTYNVSLNRRLDSNNQRWWIDDATSVVASTGTASVTGGAGNNAGNALVTGILTAAAPTALGDLQRTIALTWKGPVPTP